MLKIMKKNSPTNNMSAANIKHIDKLLNAEPTNKHPSFDSSISLTDLKEQIRVENERQDKESVTPIEPKSPFVTGFSSEKVFNIESEHEDMFYMNQFYDQPEYDAFEKNPTFGSPLLKGDDLATEESLVKTRPRADSAQTPMPRSTLMGSPLFPDKRRSSVPRNIQLLANIQIGKYQSNSASPSKKKRQSSSSDSMPQYQFNFGARDVGLL